MLYHTETLKKVVYAFHFNERGESSGRRVFVALPGRRHPDGMAGDVEGFVWIAVK